MVNLRLSDYEVLPQLAVIASKVISDMFIRLGQPTDPFSKAGEKMMHILIAVWEDLYPKQAKQWYDDRAEYKKAELSIKSQVQQKTGRSLASFPLPIYHMMRKVFPNYKLNNRDDYIKLVKKYPLFKMANKI